MKTDPSCPTCGAPMYVRSGKFGDFYYCKNSVPEAKHRTISVRAWHMVVNTLTMMECSESTPITPYPGIDLEFEVRRKMGSFGVIPSDLDLFVEGELSDIFGRPIDYSDDDDHWTNFRPY